MAKSAKKTVALYHAEQVEAYEAAREALATQGVDVEELSEGDVLAALSREYTSTGADQGKASTTDTDSDSVGFWDAAAVVGPALVLLLWVVGALLLVGLFLT